MKKNGRVIINIGTASLILVFAVLALVTFAMLSLSSASAKRRLAEKMAERTTEYYQAEALAAEQLAEVEELLENAAVQAGSEADFLEQVEAGVMKMQDRVEILEEAQIQPEEEKPERAQSQPEEEEPEGAQSQPGEEGLKEEVSRQIEISFESGRICWEVTVSERQSLAVEITPLYQEENGRHWKMEHWELVTDGEWNGQDSLELYSGGA